MYCHCGTNNRAPRWTFTDPCKPEVRPGAREESASPAWRAAPAMNARDTTKVYIWRLETGCGPTLYRKCHSNNTPGKGIITLESNPSRGTVLPAPHGKGNKCDKNVKYRRTDVLSLWHQQTNLNLNSFFKIVQIWFKRSDKLRNLTFGRSAHCTQVRRKFALGSLKFEGFFSSRIQITNIHVLYFLYQLQDITNISLL